MQLTTIPGKSPLASAIRQALTRTQRLRPRFDHGILGIDDNAAERRRTQQNAAERSMRAVARGPKKYPFAGSGTGGKAAAIACSLIETAKLNGVDPNVRLADTLARIPDCKIDKVDDLLPWRWNRQRSDRTLAAGRSGRCLWRAAGRAHA